MFFAGTNMWKEFSKIGFMRKTFCGEKKNEEKKERNEINVLLAEKKLPNSIFSAKI